MTRWLAILVALTALLAGDPAGADVGALPPVAARVDYQLGGVYKPAAGVQVVTRDRTAHPAKGTYSICYVNAFQTQPGRLKWWKARHPDLLLRKKSGALVTDPGWPDEVLFDIRTAAKRTALADVADRWFAGCKRDGFQAIEPDNLDSWTRSKGLIRRRSTIAMARLLTASAHSHGLPIAQKNTLSLAPKGKAIGFDFAVTEECQVYAECGGYRKAYGAHVIEIEYSDNGRRYFTRACKKRGTSISVIFRDRELVKRGNAGYVYETC
ncbi:endo alpha-1,4 polygalactosaminidase [soil metagenome]